MRICFYSCGSAGDVLPFARLAATLKHHHEVSISTHAGYGTLANQLGIAYHPYDSTAAYQRLLGDAHYLNTPSGIPKFLRAHVLPAADRVIAQLSATMSPGDLIIAPPLFDIAPRLAAEKLGLTLLSAFLAPVQVTASELRGVMIEKVLGPDIQQLRTRQGLSAISDWRTWLDYSSDSLALWPEWFGQDEPGWIEGIHPIGFVLDRTGAALAHKLEQFLDRYPTPALVTGGTGAFLGADFYSAAIDALALANVPAIIVCRYPELLPAKRPNNMIHIKQASFSALFPRVSLVIHHGGVGTLAAAVAAATPQLILAYGADRPDNGQRIAQRGLGSVRAPAQWQPAILAEDIKQLRLNQAVLQACEKLAAQVNNAEPGAAAELVVQQLAKAQST